jgi:hypothetical protein
MENTLNEMIEDVEFVRLFDAYDEFCVDVSNDDGDGVSEGPIDGGSDDGSDSCCTTSKQSYWLVLQRG